jgi:hypothetical protein
METFQVRLVIAFLFELASAKTDEFGFDAALEIQMSDQMSLLLIRRAAFHARKAAVLVHKIFTGSPRPPII